MATRYVLPLDQLRMNDVATVGGKNASLGELISQLAAAGVRVPGGFATTAQAFDDFLAHNQLTAKIGEILGKLDVEDVAALSRAGTQIRSLVEKAPLPPELERQIREAYERIAKGDDAAATASRPPAASSQRRTGVEK